MASFRFLSVFLFSPLVVAHPHLSSGTECPVKTSSSAQAFIQSSSSMLEQRFNQANQEVNTIGAETDIDFKLVQDDIKTMFKDSQSWWPADLGNYAPFMIRQAWHCAGSYRAIDGLGGCDGGRQRFNPELSWDDNVNLDKAKRLLWPIKSKYGDSLSWGDLIILTGTTAIQSMYGPVLGFCGGRVDDSDGADSTLLGPTPLQEELEPCPVNGQCKSPLGSTTIGLIYVNPGGPMGVPDPAGSALEIRDAFSRMDFNDEETVALIGGGHTFGKAHGACPLGPGPSPLEDPVNPWPYPGPCGDGIFTSGFEGAWVDSPTHWSGEYFYNLLNLNWTQTQSPANKIQWSTPGRDIMMMTSDIALISDPTYKAIVENYANNSTLYAEAFQNAWYKLATADMGPVSRCTGDLVPPAQPFQNPLPPPPTTQPDWTLVKQAIQKALVTLSSALVPDSSASASSSSYYGALFVSLGYACMSTFRSSDWRGGCNGARLRFSPERDWTVNKLTDVDAVLNVLNDVKQQFGDKLTWADLVTLASTVALSSAVPSGSVSSFSFCPGRSDAVDGSGSLRLSSVIDYGETSALKLKLTAKLMGLTLKQFVVLQGRLRSPSVMGRLGYSSSTYASDCGLLSNQYFVSLLNNEWTFVNATETTLPQYQSGSLFVTPFDITIRSDPSLLAIAQQYASNYTLFQTDFTSAWTLLAAADRFEGPTNNVCANSANIITV